MSCCKSCADGGSCETATPAGVIVPGPDPAAVIERPCDCEDRSGTVHFNLVPGRPEKIAWRLGLVAAFTLDEVSQAYELGPCNAVRLTFAVLNSSGISMAWLEGSLDKVWWEQTAYRVQLAAIGRYTFSATALTWRFVRLRYSQVVSPLFAVLSATIVGTCDVP